MFKSDKISIYDFTKFEQENDLFMRKYNNAPYWEMLRFDICQYLFYNFASISRQGKASENYRKKIFRQIKNLHNGLKSRTILAEVKSCDFVYFYSGRMDKRLFDYWDNEKYEHFTLSFESIPGIYNLGLEVFKSAVLYHFRKAFKKIRVDQKEKEYLCKLEERLTQMYGRSLSADEMETIIQKYIVIKDVFGSFYSKIFEITNPKAFVLVDYYKAQLYPAYIEARKRNIPIIEFQHGSIINHQEYWFDDQRGINNYTPDYMLTFGELWSNYIKLLPHTKVVPVGFPFQENEIKELASLKTNEKLVIVYPVIMEGFEDLIILFAEMIVKDGYKVMIKIHPNQFDAVDKYYPKFVENENIEIIKDRSKSIYYWLKLAKHHVLTNTTVAMEAVAIDGSNICVALGYPHEEAKPVLDSGIARGFYTAEELRDIVYNPINGDRDDIRDKLWRQNAARNINEFFADFVKN